MMTARGWLAIWGVALFVASLTFAIIVMPRPPVKVHHTFAEWVALGHQDSVWYGQGKRCTFFRSYTIDAEGEPGAELITIRCIPWRGT